MVDAGQKSVEGQEFFSLRQIPRKLQLEACRNSSEKIVLGQLKTDVSAKTLGFQSFVHTVAVIALTRSCSGSHLDSLHM